MVEKKKNEYFPGGESASMSGPVRCSYAERLRAMGHEERLETIRKQIEFDCFAEWEKERATEYALIIERIMKLPPDEEVRIQKKQMPAGEVAEIYAHLTHEHVRHVMENFAKVTYEIKNILTYIRTALYNSVFELTSRIDNRVQAAMAQNADW